ncbi:MAG: nucleotide exchange factor GrpE [Flavipsychrobacter sp.]|jgi:molecular chaperone GrpE|nr:nucleotide exchange factor GrpE [Flavipsychrobacter sp.]
MFKKKRDMTEKKSHNKKTNNESADNMAQNDQLEEAISNELNTDDNRTGEPLPESNNEEAEKLRAELDEMKDKHIRLVAEFDNFRRRNAKERVELIQTAGKDIVQSLLVVMDDVDRAEKQINNTDDLTSIKEGINLVFSKLRNIMQQKGLKAMEAKDEVFNPDMHEAITEIPAPNPDMVGKVIDVVEQGYYLNDKLIRHAKVVVGK